MSLFTMAEYSADLFLHLVGQEFLWERPGPDRPGTVTTARMRLLEVKRYAQQPGMAREAFSLLFVMKDQAPLGRGLHRLRHPAFEPCEVFLSRVTVPKYEASEPAGMFYEALFT